MPSQVGSLEMRERKGNANQKGREMYKICFVDFYDRVHRNGKRVERAIKLHRIQLDRQLKRAQVSREPLMTRSVCDTEVATTTERKAYHIYTGYQWWYH